MKVKNYDWVDVCKAIGIIFVIIGHSTAPFSFITYIYSFHMPLFFFLSGFLFDIGKYDDSIIFLKRKMQTLIIPYFVLSFIKYLYWLFFVVKMNFTMIFSNYVTLIYLPLKGIITVNSNLMTPDGTLWFVPCLFIAEVLFYFMKKIAKRDLYLLYLFICEVIFNLFYYKYLNHRLFWGTDIAFTAMTFYGAGYFYKKLQAKRIILAEYRLMFLPILLVINLIFAFKNPINNMYINQYGNLIYLYIAAFSGIAFYVIVSQSIINGKLINYIGKNTLIILSFHIILLRNNYFLNHFNYFITGILKLNIIPNGSIVYEVLYSLTVLICLLPIIFLINRYLPFIVGKNKTYKLKLLNNRMSKSL